MGGHSSEACGSRGHRRKFGPSDEPAEQGGRKKGEKEGGGPQVFCKCSFQEGLSPVIL